MKTSGQVSNRDGDHQIILKADEKAHSIFILPKP